MADRVRFLAGTLPHDGSARLVRVHADVPAFGWREDDIVSVVPLDRVDCDSIFQLVTGDFALIQHWHGTTFYLRSCDGVEHVLLRDEVHGMVCGRVKRRWTPAA